tara:strand:+ start:209 stop:949 length:741 start_codon:yes stop_codon:yes gene_type:complete
MFESFFGTGLEFWIGKVVVIDAQKKLAQGDSWGWRYKVRIFGTYSNSDNVEDKDCHTAMVMLGVSDGSGGGGAQRSVRITQHDIVFGFFMAPDQNLPVIVGVLGRQPEIEGKNDPKFGVKSGYTKNKKRGLVQNNEHNRCDSTPTPKVLENSTQGSGEGKEIPEQKLRDMGQGLDQKVNAITPPQGFQNFDLNGLNQDQINLAVGQAKDFAQSVGQDFKDSPIIDEVKTFGKSALSEAQNTFNIPE